MKTKNEATLTANDKLRLYQSYKESSGLSVAEFAWSQLPVVPVPVMTTIVDDGESGRLKFGADMEDLLADSESDDEELEELLQSLGISLPLSSPDIVDDGESGELQCYAEMENLFADTESDDKEWKKELNTVKKQFESLFESEDDDDELKKELDEVKKQFESMLRNMGMEHSLEEDKENLQQQKSIVGDDVLTSNTSNLTSGGGSCDKMMGGRDSIVKKGGGTPNTSTPLSLPNPITTLKTNNKTSLSLPERVKLFLSYKECNGLSVSEFAWSQLPLVPVPVMTDIVREGESGALKKEVLQWEHAEHCRKQQETREQLQSLRLKSSSSSSSKEVDSRGDCNGDGDCVDQTSTIFAAHKKEGKTAAPKKNNTTSACATLLSAADKLKLFNSYEESGMSVSEFAWSQLPLVPVPVMTDIVREGESGALMLQVMKMRRDQRDELFRRNREKFSLLLLSSADSSSN